MKKYLWLLICLMFCFPLLVFAEDARKLEVEFSYSEPENVQEYKFWMDQTVLCTIPTANVIQGTDSSFECEGSIPSGWHTFTMTAVNLDDTETAHSPGFEFFSRAS